MLFPVTTPGGSSGQLQWNSSGVFGGAAALVYAASGTHLTAAAQAATDVPLAVKAAGSQSARTFEVRNSSNTVLAGFESGGALWSSGSYNETTTTSGFYGGISSSTPRCMFANGTAAQNWQIDNNSGSFRWFTPGTVRMTLNSSGSMSVASARVGDASLAPDSGVSLHGYTSSTSGVVCRLSAQGPTFTGNHLEYYGLSSTPAWRAQGAVQGVWVDSTDASRKARLVYTVYDTAAREAMRHEASGSAAMIGFLGATAVARPTAYTQTYSTATRTHANFTSSDLTGITSSTTGSALAEPSAAYTQSEMQQNFRRIQDQFVLLRADVANLKQLVNSVIDDHQSYGLFG